MYRGQVKWFSNEKGFGFIESKNFDGDVFVHYSAIKSEGYKSLEENERVQFEAERGPKGWSATHVVSMDAEAAV